MAITTSKIILSALIRDNDFSAKVFPYLKEEYFYHSDKVIFEIIKNFINKYSALPSKDAILIELENTENLRQNIYDECKLDVEDVFDYKLEETDNEWLVNTAEKYCKDNALHLGLQEAVLIAEKISTGKGAGLSETAIPDLLLKAVSVSFDNKIGTDYIEEAEERYDYYNIVEDKIPTDIDIFNKVTNGGFSKGTLNIFLAGTAGGKAICNDALIYTPSGEKRFGDIKVGDYVYGSNGKPTKVLAVYPQGIKESYKVTFIDGRTVECDLDHLWNIFDYKKNEYVTKSLREIIELRKNKEYYRKRTFVPLTEPVELGYFTEHDVDPYVYGKDIIETFIPEEYLFSTIKNRQDLLKGLFSFNAIKNSKGIITFCTFFKQLANDVSFIVRSLGGIAKIKENENSYTLTIDLKEKYNGFKKLRIDSIERIEDKECTCITVDAEDSLYTVEEFVVTHNTLTMCSLAASMLLNGKNVLYITLEIDELNVAKRIDANLLDVDINKIGVIGKSSYVRGIDNLKKKTLGKLIINEDISGNFNAIRLKSLLENLKLKKQFIPDVICIDYLGLMKSSAFKEGTTTSYIYFKAISEEIRLVAKQYDVALITAVQLNRSAYDDSDAGLTGIADSWGITNTADFISVIIQTEELQRLNQYEIKQLKSRYSDMSQDRRFCIGVDKNKMRLYNLDTIDYLSSHNEQSSDEDIEMKLDRVKKKNGLDTLVFD